MKRTRIKMCGTTNLEDARAAVRAGVDALGFIFVKKSPRFVTVQKAREIVSILPPFVDPVGVFLDFDPKEVAEIAREVGLTCLQLHGKEEPAYCLEVSRLAAPCKVIKAFRVGEQSRAGDFARYHDVVQGFLLDTYVKGLAGGTGETFGWQLVDRLDLQRPVILAGGLCPDNILEAVRKVRPYGIDVNSGVELSPGRKDQKKLGRLVDRVRLADNDPDPE